MLRKFEDLGRLEEDEVREIVRAIVDSLIYCHGLGVVHRDVKLDNFLFTSRDHSQASVKLSDFGFARHLVDGALATTTCGTPTYVAPEILQ